MTVVVPPRGEGGRHNFSLRRSVRGCLQRVKIRRKFVVTNVEGVYGVPESGGSICLCVYENSPMESQGDAQFSVDM